MILYLFFGAGDGDDSVLRRRPAFSGLSDDNLGSRLGANGPDARARGPDDGSGQVLGNGNLLGGFLADGMRRVGLTGERRVEGSFGVRHALHATGATESLRLHSHPALHSTGHAAASGSSHQSWATGTASIIIAPRPAPPAIIPVWPVAPAPAVILPAPPPPPPVPNPPYSLAPNSLKLKGS